ncbi:permease prefix domain 1-containing protein [Microbacterium sp. P5_E9]
MTSTLTDRYVDAAMRTVPEKQRPDLSAELRASIGDQIDARVEGGDAPEAAERAVLTDLGDPDKLAAGYTDRPLHLIGPRYYLDWWRLLKLLLWIVLPFAAFGVALGLTLAGKPFGEIVGTVWVVLLTTTVHLFFWTTLVFAVVERSGSAGAKPLTVWTVDHLPEPRAQGAGFVDMIANIVFLAIGAAALVWDQTIGFGFAWIDDLPPVLNPGLWPWWIAVLLILMAVEAGLGVIVYLVGRWTIPLAVTKTLLDLAIAVPAMILLVNGRLLNPAFFPAVIPDASDAAEVASIIAVITGFCIVGFTIWGIIDVFLKARRAR